jgi:hypothetical protein
VDGTRNPAHRQAVPLQAILLTIKKSINMKALKTWLCATILFAFTFSSCQKSIDGSNESFDSIKNETLAWFQSVKTNLSDTIRKLTNAKVEGLDYSIFKIIVHPENETKLFFIKTNWEDKKLTEFLSFTKINNIYHTVGFVRVSKTNTIKQFQNIESFIVSGKLEEKFRLSFYRLSKKHHTSYEGISRGGVKTLKVEDKEKLGRRNVPNTRDDGCIDWYIVTTYTYPNGTQYTTEEYLTTTCNNNSCEASNPYGEYLECINEGEGGGGGLGLGDVSNDYPDNGKLSCQSLAFTNMTTNMYEAGVSGLQFVMEIAGGGSITHDFRSIYIGFPSNTANGTHYTPGEAAAITAYAMNKAGTTMSITYFGMTTVQASTITTTQLENEFKNLVQFYINQEINAGSTASYIQSGNNTITKSAVWNSSLTQFWNGLTGSGCK